MQFCVYFLENEDEEASLDYDGFFHDARDAASDERVLDDELAYEVLSVVAEIPAGCVASYGQIARLIGRPKNARLVGKVLKDSQFYGEYPCHRVVNHAGRLVPGWEEQAALLAEEGVELKDDAHVDMRRYQWNAEDETVAQDVVSFDDE